MTSERHSKGLTGAGISQQSWPPRPHLEAEGLAANDPRLIEVHPEVSFREMHGEPLQWAKTSLERSTDRRKLLAAKGIKLP
jgi:predicted RNase H-like nuclease